MPDRQLPAGAEPRDIRHELFRALGLPGDLPARPIEFDAVFEDALVRSFRVPVCDVAAGQPGDQDPAVRPVQLLRLGCAIGCGEGMIISRVPLKSSGPKKYRRVRSASLPAAGAGRPKDGVAGGR